MDDLITCPYNSSHQIRPCRIQYHIIKCQKKHPDLHLSICPFNASHHFRKEDEKEHILECRDRRIVEVQSYNELMPGQHGCLNNPSFYGSSMIPKMPTDDDAGLECLDDTTVSSKAHQRGRRANPEDPGPPRRPEIPGLPSYYNHAKGLMRAISPAIEGRHGPNRRSSPSPARLGTSMRRAPFQRSTK